MDTDTDTSSDDSYFSPLINYEKFELEGDIGDTMLTSHNDLYVINDQREVVLLPDSIIDTDISTFYNNPLEKWYEQPGTFSVNLHPLHRPFIEQYTEYNYSHNYSLYFGYDSNERIVILRKNSSQQSYYNFEEYVIYGGT